MSSACPECGTEPALVACHDCGQVVSVLECEHTRAADDAYIAAVHAYNATPEETRLSGRAAVDAAADRAQLARRGNPGLTRGRIDGSEASRRFCQNCALNFAGNLLRQEELDAVNEAMVELRSDPEAMRDALRDILPDDEELAERVAVDEDRERRH